MVDEVSPAVIVDVPKMTPRACDDALMPASRGTARQDALEGPAQLVGPVAVLANEVDMVAGSPIREDLFPRQGQYSIWALRAHQPREVALANPFLEGYITATHTPTVSTSRATSPVKSGTAVLLSDLRYEFRL